jgi:hypothetical protein
LKGPDILDRSCMYALLGNCSGLLPASLPVDFIASDVDVEKLFTFDMQFFEVILVPELSVVDQTKNPVLIVSKDVKGQITEH